MAMRQGQGVRLTDSVPEMRSTKSRRGFLCKYFLMMLMTFMLFEVSRTQISRAAEKPVRTSILWSLRGGSTQQTAISIEPLSKDVILFVSTQLGNHFLDKKKRFSLSRNATVLELKQQVQQKFPGGPPVELQQLYIGDRLLHDMEIVGNISALAAIPVLLDMITGTSAYNKTAISVAQALEAYTACTVHLSYIGDKLRTLITSSRTKLSQSDGSMDTIHYRRMLESLHETITSRYALDISLAQEEERNPEMTGVMAADTAAWREKGNQQKPISPLAAAFAKEFDLNLRGLKNFVYYSVILAVSEFFSTD